MPIEKISRGIVIFLDNVVHVSEEECRNFIKTLPPELQERYFLKKLFIFPPVFSSMEIKDWQVVNFLRYSIFRKDDRGSRLARNKGLKYYFLTHDKNFTADAKKGFLEESKSKRIPRGITFESRGADGKIVFRENIFNSDQKILPHREAKVEVHVLFIFYDDKESHAQKVESLFRKLRQSL